MSDTPNNQHTILSSITLCLVQQAYQEKMQGLKAYKHELKQVGNRYSSLLAGEVDEKVSLIWGVENGKHDTVLYRLMDYQEGVIAKIVDAIVSRRPEDLGVYLAMMERYNEDPKAMMDLLGIQIIDKT